WGSCEPPVPPLNSGKPTSSFCAMSGLPLREAWEAPRDQIAKRIFDCRLLPFEAAAMPFDAAVGFGQTLVGHELHAAVITFGLRDFIGPCLNLLGNEGRGFHH